MRYPTSTSILSPEYRSRAAFIVVSTSYVFLADSDLSWKPEATSHSPGLARDLPQPVRTIPDPMGLSHRHRSDARVVAQD
jgi:hypothetical protein